MACFLYRLFVRGKISPTVSKAQEGYRRYVPRGSSSSVGYLYMIREREFVRLEEPVYKIGKSLNFERRFQSYPKDSQIVACVQVPNHDAEEKALIKVFDECFTQMPDYGREYYKGDEIEMVLTFLDAVTKVHTSADQRGISVCSPNEEA